MQTPRSVLGGIELVNSLSSRAAKNMTLQTWPLNIEATGPAADSADPITLSSLRAEFMMALHSSAG